MVKRKFKRRSRKRTYKRKRRSKSSKSLGRRRFFDNVYDNIQNNGQRSFHKETSGDHVTGQEQYSAYQVLNAAGTFSDYEAMIESTLGQSGNALGGNNVGINYDYFIKNYSFMFHMRNVSNHPVFMTTYELVSKVDFALTDATLTDVPSTVINSLITGWQADMGAGSVTSTTASGDAGFVFTPGNNIGFTRYQHIRISKSRGFLQRWRVLKSKTVKLNPGDDFYWRSSIRNHLFKPLQWVQQLDDPDNNRLEAKKGLTKVHMVKVTGCLGESTATPGQYGTMEIDLPFTVTLDAKVVPINSGVSEFSASRVHDADATDLTAPTHTELQVDE